MHNSDSQETSSVEFRRRQRWRWFLVTIIALTLIVGLWRARRTGQKIDEPMTSVDRASATGSNGGSMAEPLRRQSQRFERPVSGPGLTAEQVVTLKVMQFGRNRRELIRAIGRRLQKEVPPEIEKFFDAVESGKRPMGCAGQRVGPIWVFDQSSGGAGSLLAGGAGCLWRRRAGTPLAGAKASRLWQRHPRLASAGDGLYWRNG